MEVVPQAMEVKLPQVPENSSILVPEELRFAPSPLNEIVVTGCTAVKLYHTSSSAVPPHEGTAIPELLAPITVPVVFEQVVFEVKDIAPLQLSLAGATTWVTQILKLPVLDRAVLAVE